MDVAAGGFYFSLLPYNRGNEMALSCPVLRESSKRRLLKAARFNSFLQAVQTSTYLLQTFAIFLLPQIFFPFLHHFGPSCRKLRFGDLKSASHPLLFYENLEAE